MKVKSIYFLLLMLAVTACAKPYDYSGSYEVAKGDSCEIQLEENTLITLSPVSGNENIYTARLASYMSGGGVFPVESKPSKLNDDGSIYFMFFKEGKSGLFSGRPAVDMVLKIMEKNKDHVYLESWSVTVTSPNNPALNGHFDLIKDAEISVMGNKASNELYPQAGKNGLCLKKMKCSSDC